MTEPNIPLLRRMVEWAEEQENRTEDREWNQAIWISKSRRHAAHFCDTVYCIAGKVVLDAGWEPIFNDSGEAYSVTKDGQVRGIADLAAELLGITYSDWDDEFSLFSGPNDAADIRRIAEELAGEPL